MITAMILTTLYTAIFALFSPLKINTIIIGSVIIFITILLTFTYIIRHSYIKMADNMFILCLPFKYNVSYNYDDILSISIVCKGFSLFALSSKKALFTFIDIPKREKKSKFSLFYEQSYRRRSKLLLSTINLEEFVETIKSKQK